MEKLKFGVNEFELAPMGIADKLVEKERVFKFKSDLDITELEKLLSLPESFASVQYIATDGHVLNTYLDCVRLKRTGHDMDTGIYSAVFSVDAVEKMMLEMQSNAAQMQAEIEKLKAAQIPQTDTASNEETAAEAENETTQS